MARTKSSRARKIKRLSQDLFFLFLGFVIGINLYYSFWWKNDCEISRKKLFYDQDNSLLRLKVAECLLQRGDYNLALQQIGSLNKNHKDSWGFVQEKLSALQKEAEILSPKLRQQKIISWKEKIINNPKLSDSWLNIGLLWYFSGDKQKGELAINKSLCLDPLSEETGEITRRLGLSSKCYK